MPDWEESDQGQYEMEKAREEANQRELDGTESTVQRDKLARYILTVVRPREAVDHACAKCVPNGEPIAGFVCGYHLAAEIVGGT